MSPVATLYYGFYLGSPENSDWLVAEADDYGTLDEAGLPWVAAGEQEGDYPEYMTLAILLASGLAEADVPADSLDEALAKRCGVQVISHGSLSEGIGGYGLALPGTLHQADDYTPKEVAPDIGGRTAQPLFDALKALGITPNQASPSWILAPGDA